MASTVSANGKKVATSKSEHWAGTKVDERLVKKKEKKKLINKIATEHIARNYPVTVKFGGGLVWNEPVEVGDMPKSLPADTWEGAHTHKINSYASAAAGSGSPNVFVAKKKVLCKDHITEQNAENSKGIITDADGMAKMEAEWQKEQDEEAAKKKKTKSKSKGGGSGTAGKAKPAEPPPKPPPATPPAPTGCAVSGVDLQDDYTKTTLTVSWSNATKKGGPRRPEPAEMDAPTSQIQVLDGSKIEFAAIVGDAMCPLHPNWSCAKTGWQATGPKATFEVPGSAKTVKGLIGLFFEDLPNPTPIDYLITCTDHQGIKFRRSVLAFPAKSGSYEFELPALGAQGVGTTIAWLKNILAKFGLECMWKVEVLKGKLAVEGAWEEESTDEVVYKVGVSGSVLLFDLSCELRYSLLSAPIPEPTFQAVTKTLQAINAVCEFFAGRKLIDLYVFGSIKAEFGLQAKLEWQKHYKKEWEPVEPGLEIGGSLTPAFGIRVEALAEPKFGGTALARGEANAQWKLEVKPRKLAIKWKPEVGSSIKSSAITFNLVLEYDLMTFFTKAEEAENDASFWSHPIDFLAGKISKYKEEFQKELFKNIGTSYLKGSKAWELGSIGTGFEYEIILQPFG